MLNKMIQRVVSEMIQEKILMIHIRKIVTL